MSYTFFYKQSVNLIAAYLICLIILTSQKDAEIKPDSLCPKGIGCNEANGLCQQ